MEYRAFTPNADWFHILWDQPCDRPPAAFEPLLDLPGVRAYPKCIEVPRSVWDHVALFELCTTFKFKRPEYRGYAQTPTWKPPLRPMLKHQHVLVETLLASGRVLCADAMGLGKQQPVDTKVLTPDGWRQIGDLQVGDQVIGSQGQPVRVTGVFPQGVKPSFRVRFSDHSAVEAGPEHLWSLAHNCGGKRWETLTLTTEQLRTLPVLERPLGKRLALTGVKLYLPTLSAPATFHTSELSVGPYTLGQLIANGSLAHTTAGLTTAVWNWPEVRASLQAEGHDVDTYRVYGNVVQTNIPGIVGRVRALGLTVRSGSKRIPQLYLQAKPTDRVALLQGLMDGDGSVSATNNRLTYHTTSVGLAEDVQELVEGLGGIASVGSYPREENGRVWINYLVRLRLPSTILPFRVARKAARFNPGRLALPRRTLVGVEYVRDVESVCIAVDAEDNLYTTEHCILTHNTSSAIQGAETVRRNIFMSKRPVVIFAPLRVRKTWMRELLAMGAILDESEFCALESSSLDNASWRDGCPYYFVHYDVIKTWWSRLVQHRPCVSIADEVHLLKNGRSLRTKTAGLALQTTPFRILLTGTPVANKPEDLWSLLTLLNGQGSWGGPVAFRKRYCGAYRTDFGWADTGPTNEAELQARMEPFYFRRDIEAAGIELPPFQREIVEVEPQRGVKQAYDEFVSTLGPDTIRRIVAAMLQGQPADDVLKLIGQLRKETSRAKMPATLELAQSILEESGAVLVFTWERSVAKALQKQLDKSHNAVTGDLPMTEREHIVDTFQAEGGAIVATYGALAEGVTLHRARGVVLHDIDWVASIMLQAEKRIHRIGQGKACTAYWMSAKGMFDDYITAALRKKLADAELMLALPRSIPELGVADDFHTRMQAAIEDWRAW